MASGFIEATAGELVTLTTTGASSAAYDGNFGAVAADEGVLLTTHSTKGTSIGFPTAGAKWSHLEIILRDSAATDPTKHECKVLLTWDLAGDDICAGPSGTAIMVPRRTTYTGTGSKYDYMCTVDIDSVFTLPPDGTIDKVFLFVATSMFVATTPILVRARLYWHDLNNKGVIMGIHRGKETTVFSTLSVDIADSGIMYESDDNQLGIGVSDPDTKLEVLATTTQLKLSYDANSFISFTVADASHTTIATGESGNLILDSAGDIELNADGADIVFKDGAHQLAKFAAGSATLVMGSAVAEDTMVLFDGNAQDFHIALDDTADDLVIGVGSAAGTTTAIAINELAQVSVVDAFAANTGGTFGTFSDGDATPSVATGNLWKHHASSQTITMFDDGIAGQTICVISTAAITYDVTSTNLKGGSADIVTASGDVTWWTFDGTNWYLAQYMDADGDFTTVGDLTSVTAGVGLSGGGSSGDLTLTLDLSELSTVTPADGDFFATLDSDGANEQKTTTTALATLFAGTGLTASSSVLSVDASQTQITAVGTIATGVWNGTAIASAYLDADTAHLSGSQTFTGAKTFSSVLDVLNTTTSSETQGGKLILAADDGAAMGNNHRLGAVEFMGAEDASGTVTTGARIEALCEAAWSASENGTRLVFYTTDGNASESEVLKLDSNKLATFAGPINIAASQSYQVNGTAILADSGGTMTLSNIDALDATTEATIESAIDTLSNLASIGTITTGVWNGTAIASAYLDADTAHLSGTQTFTGAKTFTTVLDVLNATTSSATQGGKLILAADDGAAMGNNHRLGAVEFMGAEDASGTVTTGARIEALCEAAWSASENGTRLVFYTTDGNASESEVLKLDSDKLATFAGPINIAASQSYQVNGTAILADSGGTMTLSNIDALDATTEATIETAIDTLSNLASIGTITTGVWNGTAIASAYLDADTAHLSGTQTFTGAKTFSGGITSTAAANTLGATEIAQGASGGATLFTLDNDDTDKIAMKIEAANIDADVIDIIADAVTTAHVLDVTADALTSGSILNLVSDSSSTTVRSLISVTNDNTAATGASLMLLKNDAIAANSSVVIETSAAETNPLVELINSNAATDKPSILRFNRVSSTVADDMSIGQMDFYGKDSQDQAVQYVKIQAFTSDTTSPNEEQGQLKISAMAGGIAGTSAMTEFLSIGGEDTGGPTSATFQINQGNADIDFMVRSANINSLIRTDAANDRVGLGTPTPGALVEIQQGATGGDIALLLDNNDTDQIAMKIEAANIDADVIDIIADAVTTANVIDITADGLTSGSVIAIEAAGSSGTARNLIEIRRTHASAANATYLKASAAAGSAMAMQIKELSITLNTGSAQTTSSNFFPAGAIAIALAVRVTTQIDSTKHITKIGIGTSDPEDTIIYGNPDVLGDGVLDEANDTQIFGLNWGDQIVSLAAQQDLVITCNGTPSAGVVNVALYYWAITAPTS